MVRIVHGEMAALGSRSARLKEVSAAALYVLCGRYKRFFRHLSCCIISIARRKRACKIGRAIIKLPQSVVMKNPVEQRVLLLNGIIEGGRYERRFQRWR